MLSQSQVNHNRGRVLDLSQSIQQLIQKEQKIGQASQRERSQEEFGCDGQSFSPQKCQSLIKRFNKKPKDSENAYLKYLQNTIKEVGAKNNQHFLLKNSESAAQLTTCLDPPRYSIGASPQVRTVNINLLSTKEDNQLQMHKERSSSAGKSSITNSTANKSKQHVSIVHLKEEQNKKQKESKLNGINESAQNIKQTKEQVTNQSYQQDLSHSNHQRNGQSPRIHMNDKSKTKVQVVQKNAQRLPSKESKQHIVSSKIPTSADKSIFQNSPREIMKAQQDNNSLLQSKVTSIQNPFVITCSATFSAKQIPDYGQNGQKFNGTPQVNSSKTSNASQSTVVNSHQLSSQKNTDMQTSLVKNTAQSSGVSSLKAADIAVSQFCLLEEISVRGQIPKSYGHSKSGSTEVDSLQSSAVRSVNPNSTGLSKTNAKKVVQNQIFPMKVGKIGSAHFSSDVPANFSLVIPSNNLANYDRKNDKEGGSFKQNQYVKRINQDLQLNNSRVNQANSPRKLYQLPLETSFIKDKKVNQVVSERDRSQTQTISKDEDKLVIVMNRSSSKSILQSKNKIIVPLAKLPKNLPSANQGQTPQETLNSSANLGIATMVPSKNSQFHFQPSYFTPLDHDMIKNYLQSQIPVNKSAIDCLEMPVKQLNYLNYQPIQEISTKSLNISQNTLENVSQSQGMQPRLRADSNKQPISASQKQSEMNTPVNKAGDIPYAINSFRERFGVN